MNFTITKHSLRRGLASLSASLDPAKNVASIMLVIVGAIFLLVVPLSGVLSPEAMAVLYGARAEASGLELLFGALFLLGALAPSWRVPAYIGGFTYGTALLHQVWTAGGTGAGWGALGAAEVVSLTCLLVGGIAHIIQRHANPVAL